MVRERGQAVKQAKQDLESEGGADPPCFVHLVNHSVPFNRPPAVPISPLDVPSRTLAVLVDRGRAQVEHPTRICQYPDNEESSD